jgi:glycosyltransferase involved in cell wall biosynthesis
MSNWPDAWRPVTEELRVTHVALSVDFGGLERVILDLTRMGQKLGQKVSVICIERTGALAEEFKALGVPVLCVHKRPGIQMNVTRKIAVALRKLAPDVVHTHHVNPLFYTGPALRRAGRPVVVHTEHGRHFCRGVRWRWLGRLAGCYANLFCGVNDDIAAEALARRIVPRRKIRVIPNGIDIARFQRKWETAGLRDELGIPPNAPVVGTIGRLCEVKRQDLLLRGFAQLRARRSDAHLVLVGDGPWKPLLLRLTADLGIEDAVHFVGAQAEPERYLQLMSCFVLTSQSEGMPLTVLEAWAAGVPVLVPRVGGLPALVQEGKCGLLFPFEDQAALALNLGRVLDEQDLRLKMTLAARQRVETLFSLQRMAGEYHRHYLDLIGARALLI